MNNERHKTIDALQDKTREWLETLDYWTVEKNKCADLYSRVKERDATIEKELSQKL